MNLNNKTNPKCKVKLQIKLFKRYNNQILHTLLNSKNKK